MTGSGWLADTRASYDTVAESCADLLRDALAGATYERAILGLFAEFTPPPVGGAAVAGTSGRVATGRARTAPAFGICARRRSLEALM